MREFPLKCKKPDSGTVPALPGLRLSVVGIPPFFPLTTVGFIYPLVITSPAAVPRCPAGLPAGSSLLVRLQLSSTRFGPTTSRNLIYLFDFLYSSFLLGSILEWLHREASSILLPCLPFQSLLPCIRRSNPVIFFSIASSSSRPIWVFYRPPPHTPTTLPPLFCTVFQLAVAYFFKDKTRTPPLFTFARNVENFSA